MSEKETTWVEKYQYLNIAQLACAMNDLRTQLDLTASLKSAIQKEYDYLSMAVIPDMMEELGIGATKVTEIGKRISLRSDIRCSVPANNKELVKEWLIDHGHGSLVQEAVNSSSLKALVKEQMKMENGSYPEDLLKITAYTQATLTKA